MGEINKVMSSMPQTPTTPRPERRSELDNEALPISAAAQQRRSYIAHSSKNPHSNRTMNRTSTAQVFPLFYDTMTANASKNYIVS